MEGGEASLLHIIFQRHHHLPHEIYRLPPNEKKFIYASMMLVLEEEQKEHEKQNKGKGRNLLGNQSLQSLSDKMNQQNQ